MPIERVPNTDLPYYLIAFDSAAHERTDDPDGRVSDKVVDIAAGADRPVTDVFLMSHGWKGDIPAARDQYNRWLGAMFACAGDLGRARDQRRGFNPLLIGLHWPSLPFGDEEFGGGNASFSVGMDGGAIDTALAELVDAYAARLADTPETRAALQTIFTSALDDAAPYVLPDDVRQAYLTLDREAGLGSDGEGAAPGADREPYDPDAAYDASLSDVSFGAPGLMGGIVSLLQQMSFWKMKDRARQFGEIAGFKLLVRLQEATEGRDVRFHLMGHSFGCIVVSSTLAGPYARTALRRPVDSVALIQGALSHWSFAAEVPATPGRSGYFRSLVADQKVRGPIVTSQSEYDTAVGKLYPLAAGAARQVSFAPGELPKYGALGTFGAQGAGIDAVAEAMRPADQSYGFQPGRVYNLDSAAYICEGDGPSGAHSDIAKPEVAHAIWEAALAN